MNMFQWFVLALMAMLISVDLYGVSRHHWSRGTMLRISLWLLTSASVCYPSTLTSIANVFGITRGADLVLYAVALALLVSCTYFYSRLQCVEHQLTAIVRRLAIDEVLHRYSLDARPKEQADE